MFPVDLQIGFDDPMVAIVAGALKDEGVGPDAPLFVFIEVAFGAADGFVDEGQAAGKSDAARAGVEFQEFLVGEIGDADGFVFESGRRHEITRARIGFGRRECN